MLRKRIFRRARDFTGTSGKKKYDEKAVSDSYIYIYINIIYGVGLNQSIPNLFFFFLYFLLALYAFCEHINNILPSPSRPSSLSGKTK